MKPPRLQPKASCKPFVSVEAAGWFGDAGGFLPRLDTLAREFKACTGSHPFRDFERMILGMGFEEVKRGKTGGSRRRYYNKETGHVLMLDEPHDGEMGRGMVRRLRKALEESGAL
jgi:hypothetical protein